jgi:AraC family transcriptional regulator
MDDAALGVFDVHCFSSAGGPGSEEHPDVTQVVLPIGGVFEVHRGRDSVIADATSAVVLRAGREHRVGHPAMGGDRSLVLVFPPEVLDEALDPRGRLGCPVGSRVHLGARLLGSALRRDAIGQLEAEEFALLLLGLIGIDLDRARGYDPRGPHQRQRIERVRALVATAPDRPWRLDELALAVHCSPFHLARQFRAVTGTSITAYALRLRLALALQRLAEGEPDLARLAADLGFASHSHFSARFRSVFGVTPGSVRDSLSAAGLDEMRTFVTAGERAAS